MTDLTSRAGRISDAWRRAAALMRARAEAATPGPWHDGKGGNRYAALISDKPHPDRVNRRGWEYDEGYGGYLVGESLRAGDRAHIAGLNPLIAVAIADSWDAVADRHDEWVRGQSGQHAGTAVVAAALAYLGESW